MRIGKLFLVFAVTAMMVSSCGIFKKRSAEPEMTPPPPPPVVVEEVKETPPPPPPPPPPPVAPIREVEEKLVPVEDKPVDPHRYFVIIGSFREPDNARQHQADILEDGFRSELMRNEAGFYRVSVLASNDVSAARAEINRIRTRFPKYNDTWLLISRQ